MNKLKYMRATSVLIGLLLISMTGHAEARPGKQAKKQHYYNDGGRNAGYRHYYPIGHRLNRLPSGYLTLSFSGSNVYYHSGAYYRRNGRQFIVSRPPLGVGISILPAGYRSHRYRNFDYYSANGVFYRWNDFSRHYVVIDNPRFDEYQEEQKVNVSEQFAYPTQGQSATQTSKNRYECYLWAVDQTGVEPAHVNQSNQAGSIENYQRANGACLEARGYSVK
ncbi:MAG: hypothetical protein GKR93_08145 [Gammaproteobacteria bacterium]|nr:hypothetical protein [Gammaproteobacteria bacterium]